MTTKIRLQKTLKEGLRRCVYRRWEAEVKGKALTTQTTDLEQLYRGNTPYPIGTTKIARRKCASPNLAQAALKSSIRRRRSRATPPAKESYSKYAASPSRLAASSERPSPWRTLARLRRYRG